MTSNLCINSSCQLGVPVLDRISESVRKGDEETFRQLITLFKFNETANLNQLDSLGSHPLHLAVMFRREKMFRTMLHYKNALRLDVDITNIDGLTALEVAIKNKNHFALKKLLKCSRNDQSVLQELRQQLLAGEHSAPKQDQPLSQSTSCRSEIATHHCNDHPANSKRHLLHPICGTHWSAEICEKAVQQCCHKLTQYMDPSLITPILVSEGYLRLEQAGQILSFPTKTERVLLLLSLLKGNGKSAYQGLFKALKEEPEHRAHQELLKLLESTCESLISAGGESVNQEELEEVTTIYQGDDRWTPTPDLPPTALESSLETSDRTESGIYSATPTATHSSGRRSTLSRGISSLALTQNSRRKSTLTKAEKPSVTVKGEINHDACTNFRAPDELTPRAPLQVINAVVKRDSPPVQAATASSNTSGGDGTACLIAGGSTQPLPYQTTPTTSNVILKSSELSLSLDPAATPTPTAHFHIASGEWEDDTDKDGASGSPRVASPKVSAPINIPSRNTSCATLGKPSVTESHGSDAKEVEGPPRNELRKQISSETTSSDSSSSNGSFLNLDNNDPTNSATAKDLSHIPPARPARPLWKRFLLTFIPDSIETNSNTREQGKPLYTIGCGMKM